MYKVPNWTNILKEETIDASEKEMLGNAIREYFTANSEIKKQMTLQQYDGFIDGFEIGFKFAEILREYKDMR